jgi:hypothetical protein
MPERIVLSSRSRGYLFTNLSPFLFTSSSSLLSADSPVQGAGSLSVQASRSVTIESNPGWKLVSLFYLAEIRERQKNIEAALFPLSACDQLQLA